ncbi:HET domain-containing protein [Colletotrichum limetticola]|uniref:HET domain-containing protein n=1 Tax=Colletotrichum limetticola TaxID=1209924 RepID=A0ABQ9PZH4_9PEZI|nr:HET domain-containing protein [Colletotrichum limetticola]
MWLVNTKTLALESFAEPSEIDYAILSHTWESGEISFQEMSSTAVASTTKSKAGFDKVAKTCEIAQEKGLGYAWIDTCCIDKSSSAELSEAINSMFRWCKWFTRGWTLQELIAPAAVEFYDAGWKLRFSKDVWSGRLSTITNIDIDILTFEKELSAVPVAVKMSWAAHRRTTRVEDRAYSLLGLFDIHIPMIYGEGRKAFQRLQEEIAKETDDLSLFAWVAVDENQRYRGIFAQELAEFTFCGNYMRCNRLTSDRNEFSITNKGVRFTYVLGVNTDASATWLLPFLMQGNCQKCHYQHSIYIGLVFTAEGWVRATPGRCRLEQRPGHFFKLDWAPGDCLSRCGKLLAAEPSFLWNPVYRGFVGEAQAEDFMGIIKLSLSALPSNVIICLVLFKVKDRPPEVQLFLVPDWPWELKEGIVYLEGTSSSETEMRLYKRSLLPYSPSNLSSARATCCHGQFSFDVTVTAEVDEKMRLILSCKYLKEPQRVQEQKRLPFLPMADLMRYMSDK